MLEGRPVTRGERTQRQAWTKRRQRAALGALVACASCASVPQFHGPLAVRNQHAAQLTVQRLSPRSAEVLDAGATRVDLSTAYSSYFLSGSDARGSFVMDGELMRTAAALHLGLGGGFDVAAELPVLHASGGFLDDFVVDWHDWFGFPDQGRDAAPSMDAPFITGRSACVRNSPSPRAAARMLSNTAPASITIAS